MTYAQFREMLKPYELIPIRDCGQVIGAVMKRQNEIHVGFCRRPKTSHRGDLRRIMLPIIQQYGEVVTGVRADNQIGLALCKRLGFVENRQDERGIHLSCKEMRHD